MQTKSLELGPQPCGRWSGLKADPYRSRRLRSHERGDRLRIRVDYALLYDRSRLIHDADRRLLQRHVQSNITFHRSSPSLRGHIKLASSFPGELIPCAFVWLDPKPMLQNSKMRGRQNSAARPSGRVFGDPIPCKELTKAAGWKSTQSGDPPT
jgi:hypothetical protein